MEGLIEGRIVHYVPRADENELLRNKDKHHPAMIVQVWNVSGKDGYVNLQVFTDGSNDIPSRDGENRALLGTYWATSIEYSEKPTPGTWHWIEGA